MIENTGNTAVEATANAVVTDVFDPILTNITVTLDGTPWTAQTNYTYDQTTGNFATLPGQITVPAATYTQNPETGVWTTVPGTVTLVVSGTI